MLSASRCRIKLMEKERSHRRRQLENEIAKIKRQIADLEDLRPGTLSKQYNVCGTPGCRCKASPPQRHGPYYQLSLTRKGKSKTRFVRREEVATIQKELQNYAELRALVDRWIDLATELSDLNLASTEGTR